MKKTMTNKEALCVLKEWFIKGIPYGANYCIRDLYEDEEAAVFTAITALELTEGWIPVTERLPEDLGHYLVTRARYDSNSDKIEYEIEVAQKTIGCQWDRKNNPVIAWMPLPEAYRR